MHIEWNARNQLVGISGGTSFVYDGAGRRQSKTIGSTTTAFLHDGLNPVQEQAGSTTTNLLTGLGIDEFYQRAEGTTTETFFTDALGTTVALTDGSGSIAASYTYEAFGATAVTGTTTNPYEYTGRESDGTGLKYYRARYYHPQLQRFISEDPIGFSGGNWNLYVYVHNRPTTMGDPTGLFSFFWHGGISALAAYNCGGSFGDSLIFGLNTMLVDLGTQGTTSNDANVHAMLGTTDSNGNPLEQKAAEAAARIELIISTAPDYLAAHTAQDKATDHHYLKPWDGKLTAAHLWHDTVPSMRELRNAYQATKAVLAGRAPSCSR